MRLNKLIKHMYENEEVVIKDYEGYEVGRYGTLEDIPEYLKGKKVINVSAIDNALTIRLVYMEDDS